MSGKKLVMCAFGMSFLVITGCRLENLSADHINMITQTLTATAKASRPITDEEEYYVGRAVVARIIAQYPLLKDNRLTGYVNRVGQAVVLSSDMPVLFNGYHFAILDSREVNAFAAPGGTILITKGMLDAVRNEDELAAVLAHEIAHVCHKDGISAIEKSRWTEAVTIIGTEAAKRYGPKEVAQLTKVFEGSIDDIFKTLVVNGYGQTQEYSADQTGMSYMAKTGYNAGALKDFLDHVVARGQNSESGLLKTHPATRDRIDNVVRNLPAEQGNTDMVRERAQRLARYLKS